MDTVAQESIEANPLFLPLVSQMSALAEAVAGLDATFEKVEATTLLVSNLVVRAGLEKSLQVIADSLGKNEELVIDGKLFHRHLEGEVTYHSLCGPLTVRRCSYRRSEERNGVTAIPLELACSLVERATPALGYSVTLGYAKGDLRSYAEGTEAAHRRLPSRSTLERMAKTIGNEAREQAPKIEACLRKSEPLPEGAHGISMGLDRTSVPMEEDRAEGDPPKTRRKKRTEPYERQAPKPVDVNYRMAYVGTASVVNARGEKLVTRKYTALPNEEPDDVVDRMMADVCNWGTQDSTLRVGVVQDGAPEMWNATGRGMKAWGVTTWNEAIDRYHLDERLGKALQLVEPNAHERKIHMSAWNEDLDNSDQAIDRIQAWLGNQLDSGALKGNDKNIDEFLEHLAYIENNQERMRYRTLIDQGLPVGSGITEGACKSVIGHRACGSAQRWRPLGIGAALMLRATHGSERLPALWKELSKSYTAEIRPA